MQIFSSKEEGKEGEEKKSRGDEAKELLAKYGGAYLATSISLSIISFALCYVLISAGVDVQALLLKVQAIIISPLSANLTCFMLFTNSYLSLFYVFQVGISTNEAGEKVGTFALAYAAHKAASPIRFPPTVALTPVVAGWIGKIVGKEK